MTPENPAEILRRAANLMRARTDAASPGPWHQLCMGSEGCSVINDGHLRERKHVSFSGRKEWKADHADATYIASWHPLVTVAVADWLEGTADLADSLLSLDTPEGPCCAEPSVCGGHDPEWGCDRCGQALGGGYCSCGFNEALAVARAYLGDAS
jgi:hypothetical protein